MRDDAASGPFPQASARQAPDRLGREDARTSGAGAPQKLRTLSASMVRRTRSGGVMNDAFSVSISGKTPRASAQPFQT